MNHIVKDYGRIIDQLRKDRKISRQDLVEDIMSLRNYQRFVAGEVKITNQNLLNIVDRMRMDINIFTSYINENSNNEYSKLIDARKLAVRFKTDEARILLATVDKDNLVLEHHKFIYEATSIIIDRSLDGNDTSDFYARIETLINFPEILNYKAINLTEFNLLVLLNAKYYRKRDRKIIDFLYMNITSKTYISHTQDNYGLNLCFTSIAKGLYNMEEYTDCLQICNEGIDMIKNKHYVTGLENLIGYKALSLNKLLQHEKAIETATLLYMYLKAFGTELQQEVYFASMEKNLNIKLKDYVKLKREL